MTTTTQTHFTDEYFGIKKSSVKKPTSITTRTRMSAGMKLNWIKRRQRKDQDEKSNICERIGDRVYPIQYVCK